MPTPSTDAPELLATPAELRRRSTTWRAAGLSVGMVPTMGALHAGHRALIDRAVADNDRVVVTIFVNPAQFGPGEDFARYPRTMDADLAVLASAGVDAAFAPTVETMYPPGIVTRLDVAGPLGNRLEGASRPGHFNGVALIVTKLLVAGLPDRAYFGQKDAQQCAVVRHLARDLDTGVEIVVCPTVRDVDGLAISSRNVYLSPEERARASAIPSSLAMAMARFDAGERDAAALATAVRSFLENERLDVDYVAVVEAEDFAEVETAVPTNQIVLAARIGNTRLIDVVRLGVDTAPVGRGV
ncbi:MAG: pantoate--beta-alanine ligase [Candidatus Dormiibacterota bacterium]